LVERIPELILALIDGIVANLPALLTASVQIIVQLAQGIMTAIPQLLEAVPEIISSLVQAFGELAPQIWEAGKQLIVGLWQGISDAGAWLWEQIKGFGQSVIDNIKGIFGIASPSTVMSDQVGKQIAAGIGDGISDNEGAVTDATDSLSDAVLGGADLSAVGAALVNTLGNGMIGKIADAVADFIDELITALHNSMIPVLAMFSELGGLFVDHLISGMVGHRPKIISEAVALAQAANAAFFGALQPTIFGDGRGAGGGLTAVEKQIAQAAAGADTTTTTTTEIQGGGGSTALLGQRATVAPAALVGQIIFNQPVTSPTQNANRIARELAEVLYA
jgi:hypothetical protein